MLTPADFKARWRSRTGSERALYQEHFRDLRAMLGQEGPDAPAYEFERPVTKAGGGQGFADVWVPGRFAMEYKREGRDLRAAYAQLLAYKDDLGNPPLLVVSDLRRIHIHPNFPNAPTKPIEIDVDEIDAKTNREYLTWLFTDPDRLHPGVTREYVTQQAAARFGAIAAGLTARGEDPARVAHLLVQLLFCLFAEDAGVLPRGLVKRTLDFGVRHPEVFDRQLRELLDAMRTGGFFAMEVIPEVNGGLFRVVDPLPLGPSELAELAAAAALDWSSVEPAIFGTLFERSLDPASRAQLGAHYTGRPDIVRVVEPVVMVPLRRRWEAVRAQAAPLVARIEAAATPATRRNRQAELAALLLGFREELAAVTVLDPACGSGNFLYVALELLLELDREVIGFGTTAGLSGMTPLITPGQLRGLEINAYARELAQVVVWIGYLQWMIGSGFGWREPVLASLETIELRDALLDRSDPVHPSEAEWPAADFIIGNPPFLGAKKLRAELGNDYALDLFSVFGNRVPGMSDLVAYFFEKARAQIEAGQTKRAGLLATNSIRGGASRRVLDRIQESGRIFAAWHDEPWVLNGADVRISMVGFDDGTESTRTLDGQPVSAITSALTAHSDLASVVSLRENASIAYIADVKGGKFEISARQAEEWLALPLNPNGRPNSDVLRPWVNSLDIVRRPRDMWIIDFGIDMPEQEASFYEAPFEYVKSVVKPAREGIADRIAAQQWWRHTRPVPGMRRAVESLSRYIATPTVAKHRVFAWLSGDVLADHQLVVFAREDDYFFGVLHSRAHEVWSLRMGTSLEDRPRYTPTTCFETFPLPWPPTRGPEPEPEPPSPSVPLSGGEGRPTDAPPDPVPTGAGRSAAERAAAIGEAARALDEQRSQWLNPEGATPQELKTRTLTNLYNARPAWLANAHAALDRAVWAAYGWPDDPAETTDEQILERLLALNKERADH